MRKPSARPTHCTRCSTAFVNEKYEGHHFKEIPHEVMVPPYEQGPVEVLCFRCAGGCTPRVVLWNDEDREQGKYHMLKARENPEAYRGWHTGLNGGSAVLYTEPGALPRVPIPSDVQAAQQEVQP
jgi:hypothetical protein